MSIRRTRLVILSLVVAATLAGVPVRAAGQVVNLNGAVSDGSGGPLLTGVVYRVIGAINVPTNTTLTVQPGAILKFASNNLTVNGTLVVNGTTTNHAIFTSIQDDSAGGDTNGNGPSVGNPGDWQAVLFQPSSGASNVHFAEFRFGGQYFGATVLVNNAGITLEDSTIIGGSGIGLDLSNNTTNATVTRCAFNGNAQVAVNNVPIQTVPGFSNNTATGNAGGNFMRITNGTLASSLTIGAPACLNGVLVLANVITVPSGITLTLGAGVIIKMQVALNVNVSGTLITNGTAAAPVVFTAFGDDAWGGDTNNNGPSTGNAGAWQALLFGPTSDASTLRHTLVRFGGNYFATSISLNQADILIEDCSITAGSGDGLDLNGNTTGATVTGCAIDNCTQVAVNNVPIQAVPGFTNNTAAGNGGGNFMRITNGALASSLTIGPSSCLNGALVLANVIAVPSGMTLTLDAGVIIKMQVALNVNVSGTLVTNGTTAAPVVFTAFSDDAWGGDTNNNGPSTGNAGAWQALLFGPASDASTLRHTLVRFGGNYFGASISLNQADILLEDCSITGGLGDGLDLNGNTTGATVTRCAVDGCTQVAVNNVPIQAVPGFTNNTAAGNGGGNYMRVTNGTPNSNLTIGLQSCLNGALVLANGLSVPTTVAMTVQQGVVVKFQVAASVSVSGTLNLLGTAFEPIVFTSYADDEWAGDTNNNGASSGTPGQWQHLYYGPGASASRIENVLLRYGGNYFGRTFENTSAALTAKSLRAEHGNGTGLWANALQGNAENWVAFHCTQGIEVAGGTFSLLHATSTANSSAGLVRTSPLTATVVNTISYGNGGPNFSGFTAAQVSYSDGSPTFAGSNGNINADPLFVNPALSVGDLRLQAGSPCLNIGDVVTAYQVVKDHAENSRLLDPDLSGVALPDLGAYERGVWTMTVTGRPRIGTFMAFGVNGPPGQTFYGIGSLDGVIPIYPFGFVLVGQLATIFILPPIPVGQALPVNVPADPSLVGITAGIQTLTVSLANPAVGNTTALYRATFRP